MAVSTVTVTVEDEMVLPGKNHLVMGTLAVSPSTDTYAVGGLALGAAEFAGKVTIAQGAKARDIFIHGKAGYLYEYDKAAGKMLIRAQTNAAAEDTPLGELAAAATPAGVSGDTIRFLAIFDKFPQV